MPRKSKSKKVTAFKVVQEFDGLHPVDTIVYQWADAKNMMNAENLEFWRTRGKFKERLYGISPIDPSNGWYAIPVTHCEEVKV